MKGYGRDTEGIFKGYTRDTAGRPLYDVEIHESFHNLRELT